MQSVTRRIHLDAPPAQVWPVLEDVSLLPLLSPSTVEVDGPERLERVGDTFSQTVTLVGRRFTSTWTVTAIDVPRLLTVEGSVVPGTWFATTEELDPVGQDASTLSLRMDYRLPFGPLGRLASRLGAERRAIDEAGGVLEGIRRLVRVGEREAGVQRSRR